MHTIYEKLWLISSELNHLTKVNKKSLYMYIYRNTTPKDVE